LRLVTVAKVRVPICLAGAHHDTKRAYGDAHDKAMRRLKRRLVGYVRHLRIAGQRRSRLPTGRVGARGPAP
jgi:hypothetical protein